ncbi:hypothetical protein C7H19_00730 [Aphanothece hegewaldii CCALA 016]|uniref:Uncharacterized protein n=1 Tax=Aphanothece hegewaldii CCALA 016 TaxID=2107694 RepID=A0A2T1M3F8_9CHRO|nr:hypothetical protein [Aphanothece hegewaldii]PSF39346.1 hypothetical protein C7H19_00730 [Aphanothece hegewaldii CCALA 016]
MFGHRLLSGCLTFCLLNVSFPSLPIVASPLKSSESQMVAQATNKITESAILKILEELKTAREKKDIDGMLKYIAPFAYTEVTVQTDNGRITINVQGTDEHRDLLTKSAQLRNASTTLDETAKVDVAADGNYAIATLNSTEQITTAQGATVLTSGNDILRFGMVNNQPMIVSATLNGWLSILPADAK